jgi:hypothetical protein
MLDPLYTYLQLPLETGALFEDWKVIDNDAVLSTPLRTFNNVIMVLGKIEDGTRVRFYFAKRYGEVKS